MDKKELTNWIEHLISIDRLDKFYHSRYFTQIKLEVLKEQHYECQRCKEYGKLTIVKPSIKRSGVVHHVQYVRKHPELALSKYYIDKHGNKQRNLITLCNPCHEIVHERFEKSESLNEERW